MRANEMGSAEWLMLNVWACCCVPEVICPTRHALGGFSGDTPETPASLRLRLAQRCGSGCGPDWGARPANAFEPAAARVLGWYGVASIADISAGHFVGY